MNIKCVLFLIALLSFPVEAFDIELSGGYSKLGKGPNGTWYQEPFPYDVELKSISGSVGTIFNKQDGNYWRAGYMYLGRGRSRAVATASDENYAPNNPPTYCNGNCWDMSHWYGHGTVQGLYLSRVFGLNTKGIKIDTEAGAYLYFATWTMTIPDWKACELCGPQYLQVQHKTVPYLTPFFSVGIENIWVSYFPWIQAQGDKYPAIYRGAAFKAEYRYAF